MVGLTLTAVNFLEEPGLTKKPRTEYSGSLHELKPTPTLDVLEKGYGVSIEFMDVFQSDVYLKFKVTMNIQLQLHTLASNQIPGNLLLGPNPVWSIGLALGCILIDIESYS